MDSGKLECDVAYSTPVVEQISYFEILKFTPYLTAIRQPMGRLFWV